MARKTIKKPIKAAGIKQTIQKANTPKDVQAEPSTAQIVSSPATPPPAGSSLPAVIPPAIAAEYALQERQRKQKWTGLPKRSKMRAKAAIICAMRIQGRTNEEISEATGLTSKSIRQYMWIAGKNGWLTVQDPHDYAENILLNSVASNLEEWLHARDSRTGLPDKEITLELAKRGLNPFKEQLAEAPVNQQANMLSITIQMPEGAVGQVRPGTTTGVPAYSEGEFILKS